MRSKILQTLAAAAMLLAAGPAAAAPYSIRYTGTMSTSFIPGISPSQGFDVTFVFDNGGSTAASQTWNSSHLKCTIWRFNTARNLVYTQNLVGDPPSIATGTATTNSIGVLTGNFTEIRDIPVTSSSSVTVSGGSLAFNIAWFANNVPDIFADNGPGYRAAANTANGIQMAASNWTNPVPFNGDCAGTYLGTPPVYEVPTLSQWAMILLAMLMGGAGWLALRRRAVG
jgi:hypothetical protein